MIRNIICKIVLQISSLKTGFDGIVSKNIYAQTYRISLHPSTANKNGDFKIENTEYLLLLNYLNYDFSYYYVKHILFPKENYNNDCFFLTHKCTLEIFYVLTSGNC